MNSNVKDVFEDGHPRANVGSLVSVLEQVDDLRSRDAFTVEGYDRELRRIKSEDNNRAP